MLKIYNSYYMYQLDHGEWSRFGYTGWFCKEETEVIDSKTILQNCVKCCPKRLSPSTKWMCRLTI